MGATIEKDEKDIFVVRISGALRKEELDAAQAAAISMLGPNDIARVLVLVGEDFSGWVGGEVWNDMSFFMKHGDRIKKIAIVGEPKWEARMMMFTAAGIRRTKVKYFGSVGEAYAWLGEATTAGESKGPLLQRY